MWTRICCSRQDGAATRASRKKSEAITVEAGTAIVKKMQVRPSVLIVMGHRCQDRQDESAGSLHPKDKNCNDIVMADGLRLSKVRSILN